MRAKPEKTVFFFIESISGRKWEWEEKFISKEASFFRHTSSTSEVEWFAYKAENSRKCSQT